MREKLFAFPKDSSHTYVQIFPDGKGPFKEATVCMRLHSDLTRQYSLFSLATPKLANTFRLFNYSIKKKQFKLTVNAVEQYYDLQDNDFKEWTSICASWRSSGAVVFINQRKYDKRKISVTEIKANPIIIIGEEQDSYGGGFNKSQSFVGEMTDVNMWDKALTDEDMMDYFAGEEMSGNIIDWKALRYTIGGNVIIKPYSDPYPCEAV
ncbi:hypothetical protein GDO81_010230 [Engystomops pustulosus]|uniref:Pentraxin family member n=1 Tax=Engystomops pustulosus TaxID=76066 RepID=A0AAV7BY00_ENGPU|nr:hypothetical protein GDO81_010230 [Engystomops pustulosus]